MESNIKISLAEGRYLAETIPSDVDAVSLTRTASSRMEENRRSCITKLHDLESSGSRLVYFLFAAPLGGNVYIADCAAASPVTTRKLQA